MDNWALVMGFLMLDDINRKGSEEKVMSSRDQRSAESRALAEGGARGRTGTEVWMCAGMFQRRGILMRL